MVSTTNKIQEISEEKLIESLRDFSKSDGGTSDRLKAYKRLLR